MATILLANPKGGRPLAHFNTLCIDRQTGASGFKLGYLENDCLRGEPVVIPIREINRFMSEMGIDGQKQGIWGRLGHHSSTYRSSPVRRPFWASRGSNYELIG